MSMALMAKVSGLQDAVTALTADMALLRTELIALRAKIEVLEPTELSSWARQTFKETGNGKTQRK